MKGRTNPFVAILELSFTLIVISWKSEFGHRAIKDGIAKEYY